ncbi:MAG TPA: hypothetical protein VMV89_02080 [Candidatus Paceibacterota bacterium]|nr:hypothetical protein [Candidatus Paceibacterota bacterium]
MQRLAATAGIDPKDADAVRRFDRRRPKKMSNEEWVNPHDPDAKIGPTKAGATDMIYKPEPTVDLDTGAILQAEVRPGDEADQRDLGAHVLQAQVNINRAQGQEEDDLTIKSVTADKGYHALPELKVLQAEGIRTVVPDPVRHRNLDHLDQDQLVALRSARRSTRSRSGKDLWRRRGMHLERSFAPLLDAGGGAADHLARLGELEQALQSVGRHLQLIAAHAATVRNGDAKTACGPGESLLGLYLSLAGDVHQGMPEHQHEFSVLMGFAPNDIWGPGKILGARVLRLDSARLGKSDYINRLLGGYKGLSKEITTTVNFDYSNSLPIRAILKITAPDVKTVTQYILYRYRPDIAGGRIPAYIDGGYFTIEVMSLSFGQTDMPLPKDDFTPPKSLLAMKNLEVTIHSNMTEYGYSGGPSRARTASNSGRTGATARALCC